MTLFGKCYFIFTQGYDCASVISGAFGGVQKLVRNEVLKCGLMSLFRFFTFLLTHNLNLVINDAAEATISGDTLFLKLG